MRKGRLTVEPPRYVHKVMGVHPSMLSDAEAIRREHILDQFMSGGTEAEFTWGRRLEFTDPASCTEWDAIDQCAKCRVDVVYDSRYSHGRPHICFRCAAYWAQSGMPQLRDLAGEASFDGTDEEMFARLHMNLAANKKGAIEPPRRKDERSLNSSRFGPGDDGGDYDVATFRPRSKPSLT